MQEVGQHKAASFLYAQRTVVFIFYDERVVELPLAFFQQRLANRVLSQKIIESVDRQLLPDMLKCQCPLLDS